MSKNKNFSTKLAAIFIAGMLVVPMTTLTVFAADAPPSIDFSFGDADEDSTPAPDDNDDDAPPSLGTTSTPATTTPPKPVVPPAPKPTRTVSTATPKKVTKTGPGLLYPILLGVGSLYYFRKRSKV